MGSESISTAFANKRPFSLMNKLMCFECRWCCKSFFAFVTFKWKIFGQLMMVQMRIQRRTRRKCLSAFSTFVWSFTCVDSLNINFIFVCWKRFTSCSTRRQFEGNIFPQKLHSCFETRVWTNICCRS